ncbi:MAG: MFS transporter [Pseudomonadota bacterium]
MQLFDHVNNSDWLVLLRANWQKVLGMLFLGFSAGLPILLIFSTLSLWLREAGLERSAVTYFSWAALGYSFKFVWAPLVDKLPLPLLTPLLGRRRGWLLFAQFAVITAIVWMAMTDPQMGETALTAMAMAAVMLGFSSATQDIVIDAYRIEEAEDDVQALLSSTYVAGYRIGMVVAGAMALYLAAWFGSDVGSYDYSAWRMTYLCMAGAMLVGVATTLVIREPQISRSSDYLHRTRDYLRFLLLFLLVVAAFITAFVNLSDAVESGKAWMLQSWHFNSGLAGFLLESGRLLIALIAALGMAYLAVLVKVANRGMVRETYIEPVADFFHRYGKAALLILLLVGFYRVADIVMGVISNVFYQDMGFSKEQIATVTKVFGLWMTIMGGFLGGFLTLRFGVMKILFAGAVLTAATNLLFMLLANNGGDLWLLTVVIAADNLSGGLAVAAFIAWLSSLTSVSFTAIQYAIFSSLMTLFPKLLGGYSGQIVDQVGYSLFFLGTAIIGIPVLLLIWLMARVLQQEQQGG